jgi:hypothetical protein
MRHRDTKRLRKGHSISNQTSLLLVARGTCEFGALDIAVHPKLVRLYYITHRTTMWCNLLRNYATDRKDTGSIHDEVIPFFIFNLPNPSSRTRPWGRLRL